MFTVSQSKAAEVIEYIKNQREHHGDQSFEEEYVSLLKLNGIDYENGLFSTNSVVAMRRDLRLETPVGDTVPWVETPRLNSVVANATRNCLTLFPKNLTYSG